MKKHSFVWWLRFAFHNLIAHPLLVVGEIFEIVGLRKLTYVTHYLHDATVPADDPRNLVRLLK
mgnify:CR=1 FL=1